MECMRWIHLYTTAVRFSVLRNSVPRNWLETHANQASTPQFYQLRPPVYIFSTQARKSNLPLHLNFRKYNFFEWNATVGAISCQSSYFSAKTRRFLGIAARFPDFLYNWLQTRQRETQKWGNFGRELAQERFRRYSVVKRRENKNRQTERERGKVEKRDKRKRKK